MRPAIRCFIALTVALSLGAHWIVLQSVAWANMLLTYTATDGIAQGVVRTFNGENPCNICVIVAEGKEQEREERAVNPDVKLDGLLATETVSPPQPPIARSSFAISHWLSRPPSSPDSPPPQFA